MILIEKEVEKIFRKNRNKVYKFIGHKKTTDNFELDKAGKNFIGKNFIGVFSQDNIPIKTIKRNKYFIFNTDTSDLEGTHWCAGYFSSKGVFYIYDTYGRNTDKILPILTKQILGFGGSYVESDKDPEQIGTKSSHCGQSSISWLMCVKQLGIRNALKI